MSKKWEYGIVHIDAKRGSLYPDSFMSMDDVKKLADEETGDCKGTYGQDKWLRAAGKLGWELCCSGQDQFGLLWYFKSELEVSK
ncbi:MAG: hypothetical protein ABSC77_03260 [Terracidiphilus sp.]|jgi:hypothetical protein